MNTIELFIISLAVWRLSSLLVVEDGPFDIFAQVRSRVGVKYDEMSHPYGTNVLSKMLSCIWCVSIWISFISCALVFGFHAWIDLFLPFAVSALAIFYEGVINGTR